MKKILLRFLIVVLFIPSFIICLPLQVIYLGIRYILHGSDEDIWYDAPWPFVIKDKLTEKYNL